MSTKQQREWFKQDQHREELERTAKELGYANAFEQAKEEFGNQYPGIQSSRTPSEVREFLEQKAAKALTLAVKEQDSITRLIAMGRV